MSRSALFVLRSLFGEKSLQLFKPLQTTDQFNPELAVAQVGEGLTDLLGGQDSGNGESLGRASLVGTSELDHALGLGWRSVPASDGRGSGIPAHPLGDLVCGVISGLSGDFLHVGPPIHAASVRRSFVVLLRPRATVLPLLRSPVSRKAAQTLASRSPSRKNGYYTPSREAGRMTIYTESEAAR